MSTVNNTLDTMMELASSLSIKIEMQPYEMLCYRQLCFTIQKWTELIEFELTEELNRKTKKDDDDNGDESGITVPT